MIVDSVDTEQEKVQIDSPQTDDKFLYNFAHVALPILALGNPKKFYKDVSSENGKQYLINIWQDLAKKMGENRLYEGLDITKKVLRV